MNKLTQVQILGVNPGGVMVKVLGCGFEVSEFKVRSLYYVNFWTNTIGKAMNTLIFSDYLLVKHHYSPSTKMAGALNNPRRIICY